MTRPEILFPLFASLETLDGVGPKTAEALGALGVARPKDFLYLLPQSGVDRSRKNSVRDVVPPAVVTVEVTVGSHFPPKGKNQPIKANCAPRLNGGKQFRGRGFAKTIAIL